MKPVCFIICFTVGVCLMVFSGYVPQSASAHSSRADGATAPGRAAPGSALFDRQQISGTVTRRVETSATDSGAAAAGGHRDTPPAVYAEPAPPVAEIPKVEPQPAAPAPKPAEPAPAAAKPVEAPAPAKPTADLVSAANEPPAAAPPAASPPESKGESLVLADAGPDRVVWLGWDELTLDATGSTGDNLTYKWKVLSGPPTLVIKNDSAATTTVTGLLGGEAPHWGNTPCKFELTATDPSGKQDMTTVRYVAKAAPMLKIKPAAERRFEARDGYQLAHFTAWANNASGYESVFEISSETELTFTKVSGSNYALTGGKGEKSYLYQVTVYGQASEGSSWVEFLVDTDERIPGIIQLGVNWEGR